MQYIVCIQHYDEAGHPSHSYFPDASETFDLPYDAKQYLLALVTDELALATETTCRWLDGDTLEVVQPARTAPYQRRQFQVVCLPSDA